MVYAPLPSRTEKILASPLLRSKGEEMVSSLLFFRRLRKWSTPLSVLSKGEEMVSFPLLSRKERRWSHPFSSLERKVDDSIHPSSLFSSGTVRCVFLCVSAVL
jgi:hypothetical protein